MKLKIIFPLLTVFVILFIWIHSAMPGEISSNESGIISGIFAKLLHTDPEAADAFVRKTAHFMEYLLLGVLITADVFVLLGHPFSSASLAIGLFVPAVDETIQLFTFGRSGSLIDVWLDFSGFLTGLVCCCIICNMIKRDYH